MAPIVPESVAGGKSMKLSKCQPILNHPGFDFNNTLPMIIPAFTHDNKAAQRLPHKPLAGWQGVVENRSGSKSS
jgi:hypothetical protein